MRRPVLYLFIGFCLAEAFASDNPGPKPLEILYEWKELEYNFPNEHERLSAIQSGKYVHGNGVPIDVDIDYKPNGSCRTFITIPRYQTGIPVTLATVSNIAGPGGPKLMPYPSYEWHSSHGLNCDGITSVYRVAIDACRRLWVMDTGRIGFTQYCQPQILVFDLNTDKLIHRYRVPMGQYKPGVSLFITPIVDVRDPPPIGNCFNTKVYVADVQGFGLLVYDTANNTSWRIQNKLMYPNPEFGTHTIAGESFDLMDGIFGIALTPQHFGGERYLYFHSLAGGTENAVPLRLIDNQAIWANNSDAQPRSFQIVGSRNMQATAEAIDSYGNVYFGVYNPPSILRWNIQTPYNVNSLKKVSENYNTLQFPSGMKVIKNTFNKEELWTLTNRFQKVSAGTKNSNEINFRIQGCAIDQLLNRGGSCGTVKGQANNINTNNYINTNANNYNSNGYNYINPNANNYINSNANNYINSNANNYISPNAWTNPNSYINKNFHNNLYPVLY